jgi:tryptophan halogenase
MSISATNIVIVGGGSAGWLTANILAARYKDDGAGVSVTLVESPNVPTVGVGEGTWPSMRTTLNAIGIDEADFIRECNASMKQGTWFKDWVDTNDQPYYHPFSMPEGFEKVNLAEHWLSGEAGDLPFAEAVTPQYLVCEQSRAPKQLGVPNYAYTVNYGYHLDAGKFAALLTRHAVHNLGVIHIKADVSHVNTDTDGYIRSVVTQQAGDVIGDLFIDCTGFKSLLLGEHFRVPIKSQSSFLFNDAALAVQVPYEDETTEIAATTHSTAQSNGWIWDIGLQNRRGVGHVFSTDYQSPEDTEVVLDRYLRLTGRADGLAGLSPRLLHFEPGYREKFWVNNCVAVGLSAGFIEPLEASALVLIELSASAIADQLPHDRDSMSIVAKRFNQEFSSRWAQIIDFLKLHYVLSNRSDSPYWLNNRDPSSIPGTLQENLTLWRSRAPWYHDDMRRDEMFPAASYQYVLYGMGFETQASAPRKRNHEQQKHLAQKLFAEAQQKAKRFGQHLPPNRFLMNQLRDRNFAAM